MKVHSERWNLGGPRITDQQASQYWANIEWGCGDGLIQVPLLTGQPSVDVELLQNNAL